MFPAGKSIYTSLVYLALCFGCLLYLSCKQVRCLERFCNSFEARVNERSIICNIHLSLVSKIKVLQKFLILCVCLLLCRTHATPCEHQTRRSGPIFRGEGARIVNAGYVFYDSRGAKDFRAWSLTTKLFCFKDWSSNAFCAGFSRKFCWCCSAKGSSSWSKYPKSKSEVVSV